MSKLVESLRKWWQRHREISEAWRHGADGSTRASAAAGASAVNAADGGHSAHQHGASHIHGGHHHGE